MDRDVERYARAFPEYREALEALGRILDLQADLAGAGPGPPPDAARVRAAWRRGRPLLERAPPDVPEPRFRAALRRLRPLLPPDGAARAALDRVLAGGAPVRTSGDAAVAFVVRTALTPFYERAAAPHRHAVADGAWGRGVCPVCGSEPALGRLALPDGRRMLFCALCRIEWPFERLRCPFCRDPDGTGPQLRFFTAGGDQARRVECCDRCMRYLKTVDERVDGRRANLPLEEVVTAHLDAAATARGYR